MKKTEIILIIVFIIIGIVVGYFLFMPNPWLNKAGASELTVCFCHNYKHNPHTICTDNQALINGHNAHVQSGFDLLGECPVNTPTPTCTPTPQPYHYVCREEECVKVEGKGQSTCEVDYNCEPQVTITPSATPSAQCEGACGGWSPSPQGNASTTQPSTPTCNIPFDAPIVQGFKINANGSETYSWWNSTTPGITKLSAVWGYAPGQEVYGLDNLDKNLTNLTINGLDIHKISWFQVWAWIGQCVEKSNWFN